MKRTATAVAALAAALVALPARAASPIPSPLMTYSGYLLDGSGNPTVTGAQTLTFRFYTVPTGGTAVYTDVETVTPDSAGYFSAIIGGGAAVLDPSVFEQQLWMGIQVQGDATELPRVELTSTPYSLTADWQYLTNKPSTFPPSAHTHLGSDITSAVAAANSVPWTGITGTIFAGTGTATTAARSDHNHDTVYQQITVLQTPGTINTASNPVDWTKLKSVPSSVLNALAGVATDATLVGSGTAANPLGVAPSAFEPPISGSPCAAGDFVTGISAGGVLQCGPENYVGTVTSVGATTGGGLAVGGTASAPTLGLVKTCSDGQIMKWSATSSAWGCAADAAGTGTVTSVGTGSGLTGGPITGSGTISIAAGGVTNGMLANSSLAVTSAAPLTGGGTVSLGGSTTLGLASCTTANQAWVWSGTAWACQPWTSGTVTSVATGAGLTGGPITGTGTIAIANGGVTNGMLANPGLTVSTAAPLAGGGSVVLGGSTQIGLQAPTAAGQYIHSVAGTPPTWAVGSIPAADLPSLSSTYVDLTSNQTIGGTKTFSNPISGSVTGSASSFTGNLGGDVTGTQSANTVTNLHGYPLSVAAPANGSMLAFMSNSWMPFPIPPAQFNLPPGTWMPYSCANTTSVVTPMGVVMPAVRLATVLNPPCSSQISYATTQFIIPQSSTGFTIHVNTITDSSTLPVNLMGTISYWIQLPNDNGYVCSNSSTPYSINHSYSSTRAVNTDALTVTLSSCAGSGPGDPVIVQVARVNDGQQANLLMLNAWVTFSL